jgi:osmotically-inducible protein OsmY
VNNDSTIKERILEAYQRSELLKSLDIEVNVQGGHVKLKGRLQKKSDEAEAIDLAKTMSGVKSVESSQLY